jgi:hypothetical protein
VNQSAGDGYRLEKAPRYSTMLRFTLLRAGCALRVSKETLLAAAAFSLLFSLSSQQLRRRKSCASGRPIDPHRVTVRSCSGACKRKRLSHQLSSGWPPLSASFPTSQPRTERATHLHFAGISLRVSISHRGLIKIPQSSNLSLLGHARKSIRFRSGDDMRIES